MTPELKLNKFQNVLFWTLGIIGAIVQILGLYALLIALSLLWIHSWLFVIIASVVITSIDLYKASVFKKAGYKATMARMDVE